MKLAELRKHMKGLQCIMAPPYKKDGSLDVAGLRTNIRWTMKEMAARKFKDYFMNPMGSAGDFYSLTEDEIKTVIKTFGEEKGDTVLIAGGTGKITTAETVKMCQYAESVGADGAFIILPYFLAVTEEGMFKHFKAIADGCSKDFGIVIYNTLMSGCNWIKPSLMAKIVKEIPNVIAVKECTKLIQQYLDMCRAIDLKKAAIFCGSSDQGVIFDAAYKCDGFDAIRCNYDVDYDIRLWKALEKDDFATARKVMDEAIPLINFTRKVEKAHGPDCAIAGANTGGLGTAVTRAIMDITGLKGGTPRLPIVGLTDAEKVELKAVLKSMGKI